MLFGLDVNLLITWGAAIVAAASFVGFAYPFLNRAEKKEKYKSLMDKRRRDLFDTHRGDLEGNHAVSKTISSKESMVIFFKVQKLVGDLNDQLKLKMMQAGIRDPSAPLKYALARIFALVGGGLLALYLCSVQEEPFTGFLLMGCIFGGAGAGYFLPYVLLKNKIIKRREAINLNFPDALDLMLICIQGGMSLNQSIDRVSEEVTEYSPILAEELGILSAEMSLLNDRKEALRDFAARVGSGAARNFAFSLVQAEQYGTSVSQALNVIADELRDVRMQEAERKAQTLPAKLTVPMMLFIFPTMFVVILAPVIIKLTSM